MIHMWRRCRRPWRISLTRHPSKTSSNSISHSLRPGHAVEDHHHHHRQSALLHQEKKKTETKILQSSPPLSLLPVQPPSFPGVFFLYAAAASATLASAIAAVITLSDGDGGGFKEKVYSELKGSLVKSNNSLRRICEQLKQTGIAASVLGKSLRSVLSSANQEVRSGFELRVAALLADISAASESRRSAIVAAGGGAVVDWLLETVSCRSPTQVESARALSYLISDPNVCEAVLARPHAVPHLLRFIFSSQPYLHPSNHNNNNDTKKKKQIKHSSTDGADILKGRSMLIAAIMDIVTSSCDSLEGTSFQPSLPGQADTRDIAEALQVVEEGGMQLDETRGDDDGDDDDDDEVGGTGVRGIGIKILGGTSVLGFSRTGNLLKLEHSASNHYESSLKNDPGTLNSQKNNFDSNVGNLASISVSKIRGSGLCTRTTEFRGLWDDLQSQHVAVPFSAWALANWALASEPNRSLIQELDRDGHAIMTALMAPERTVKWHGSLVARLLLEDKNLPLTDSVPDWSFSLLSTISQATKNEDFALARVAFSAFLVSVERCNGSRTVVMSKGLHLMRDIAKQTETNRHVQEAVAKALELLSTGGDSHLSLEESQKWSSILLPWVCGKFSSDAMKVSATKILSCILEDYGPASIPISQGWLTLLLTELLDISKPPTIKGNSGPLKSDNFKTQIDQSNAQSAVQIAGQLANAVVSLARSQLGTTVESVDEFPLADLLSLEPFYVHFKDKKKNGLPRFDAADSALATLKGIKALAEICAEDSKCQKKIANSGVLCLLRRFLLRDDYEQLAAIEAYDASRVLEAQERVSSVPGGDSSVPDANDPSSSVRVPPTGHIRRHAARLLSILSLLPKVQQIIIRDGVWCKWLEDCANGRVPGCNDLKIQSYARATLLNISCSQQVNGNITEEGSSDMEIGNQKNLCPRYDDMLFLINPELPHWKCYAEDSSGTSQPDSPGTSQSVTCHNNPPSPHQDNEDPDFGISSAYVSGSNESTQAVVPLVDIVFVHGLRGGPFKTWRIADNKSSTTSKSGLVEKIDQEAGKQGTCWPREWLATDFPCARLFTVKYKTNLTQWSGASLPLQEVSSILLKKLLAAGIGDRPVVFVTHSMGGLVVKQMLYQAKIDNFIKFINNTVGVVFYSCPHFGSKLADMPWHMGLVFRPAPSIGELRSGSSRLVELNDFVRHLHNKGLLEVLSFSETKVTPIVEGYGGWAFRVEIVPIESAYPGFGELVVLDATDHINSCKPVNRTDPSYNETLEFLLKFKERAKEYVKK